MTPADFAAWLKERSLTTLAAASVLGTTRRTIERRLAGSVPITRETALACAAVSVGLGVWRRQKKPKHNLKDQVEKLGADSLLPDGKPGDKKEKPVTRGVIMKP